MLDIEAALEKIATYFYSQLRPSVSSSSSHCEFPATKEFIRILYSEGFSGREIIARIDEHKKRQQRGSSMIAVDQLFSPSERNQKKLTKNLVEPGKAYMHVELKVLPEIPRNYFDQELGEFVTEFEPSPVRMKEYYNIDNVLDYFYETCGIKRQERDKDRGAIFYILSKISIDQLLFTIKVIGDRKYRVRYAIDIDDYVQEGLEYYQSVKDEYINMEDDRGGFDWSQEDGL
jgi:hypothetical protein